MKKEVDFLVAVEAALLITPIALVLLWQAYENREAAASVLRQIRSRC